MCTPSSWAALRWACMQRSTAGASGWSLPGAGCWQPSTCTYRQHVGGPASGGCRGRVRLPPHGGCQRQSGGCRPQLACGPSRWQVALQGPDPEGPVVNAPSPVLSGRSEQRHLASVEPLRVRASLSPHRGVQAGEPRLHNLWAGMLQKGDVRLRAAEVRDEAPNLLGVGPQAAVVGDDDVEAADFPEACAARAPRVLPLTLCTRGVVLGGACARG